MARSYTEARSNQQKQIGFLNVWEWFSKIPGALMIYEWLHPCQRALPLREQLDHAIDSHHAVADKLVQEVRDGQSKVSKHLQIANEALRISDETRWREEH